MAGRDGTINAPDTLGIQEEKKMNGIERYEVNEQWAHSGIVRAGDFCFLS